MSFDLEKLYALLPAVYRIRDIELAGQLGLLLSEREETELQDLLSKGSPLSAEEARRRQELQEKKQCAGGPLQALLSVIAEQVAVLEEDLDQLYDDQFIETCAEWVVPYIGDLVGTRGLFVFPNAPFSQRAQVANTLAYRRRKGTAAVLEQLADDVTGWDASVVEYFQLLATTQYMNHLRPENVSMASLRRRYFAGLLQPQSAEHWSMADRRQWETMERLNTPFDIMTRTVDVRRIETRRGKYNIPNVGIFLWRISSHPLSHSPAFKVDDRRYLFDALGKDTPLYNKPETEDQITHLAQPINVPMPISRRVLDRYFHAYYGVDKSIWLTVKREDSTPADTSPPIASPPLQPLADRISACDLSDLQDIAGNVIGWAHMPKDRVAIDPVLGRIAFPENQPPPVTVHVTYHYGFSAKMGGGEYGRAGTFTSELAPIIQVPSSKATIQEALDQLATSGGVVEIENNEYYVEAPVITVPAGKTIELRAADERRPILILSGALVIVGGENAKVTLNGLLMSGGLVHVPSHGSNNQVNKVRKVRLQHCTFLPGLHPVSKAVGPGSSPPVFVASPPIEGPALLVESPDTRVEIEQCIIGLLRVVDGAHVQIANSIVDATAETGVAYAGIFEDEAGATLEIKNSTIIGKVHTLMMELASNTIFLASGPALLTR